MSYRELSFEISGVAPLLCHNGQLADPLNEWAKRLKELSGKRKKTDTDYEAMAKTEWFGGLYVDEQQRPVIPGTNIEAMLLSAGKKKKLGPAFKAGIICDGDWPIIYSGPKTVQELWEKSAAQFLDTRGCKLNGKVRIMRTRPIFRQWGLKFTVSYLDELLNATDVAEAVRCAGQLVGLGDYIPRYGRFQVV